MPIELDDDLIEQALRLSNVKTHQEVVQQALENFVTRYRGSSFYCSGGLAPGQAT